MAQKFYVVWEGREPGIYDSWRDCERQVKGVAARFKSFTSLEEAQQAYKGDAADYIRPAGKRKEEKVQLQPEEYQQMGVEFPSIAVDAACSGNPGRMEYRGVEAETGVQLFHFGPREGGTNNIGEFLAIVHAAAMIDQGKLPRWPIYSDSKTGQAWVREKKAKTKLQRTQKNAELFDMLQRAEQWLKTHDMPVKVMKWKTEEWGEIPADFGRK